MTTADVTFQDYRLISPDEVTPHPDNPRRGHLAAIVESIRVNGFYGAIVVQASSQRVIAGNHRLLAARQLGLEQIPATFVDVDDTTALRILAVDNRANDLAGYDNDALLELLTTLDSTDMRLDGTGYTDADLDQLLNPQLPAALTDPDAVPAAPAQPVTQAGDVWLLGPHRLLCGDARNPAHVARLLDGATINLAFTSPPYASQRKYDVDSGFLPVPPDEYVDWFAPVSATIAEHLAADGSWFVNIKEQCDDGQRNLYVKDLTIAHVRQWGWSFVDEFAWARGGVPGTWPNRFKNGWEPIFHYTRGGKIKFHPADVGHDSDDMFHEGGRVSDTNRTGNVGWSSTGIQRVAGVALPSNVLRITAGPAEMDGIEHPAAFPVALSRFFVLAYSDPGDAIYDPFMGAGTTLMAAHAEGRAGYGMEISPGYCDVILRRWYEHTGVTPTNQDTGQAFTVKSHDAETVKVRA